MVFSNVREICHHTFCALLLPSAALARRLFVEDEDLQLVGELLHLSFLDGEPLRALSLRRLGPAQFNSGPRERFAHPVQLGFKVLARVRTRLQLLEQPVNLASLFLLKYVWSFLEINII